MKAKSAIQPLKPYQPGKGIEEVKKQYNLSHIVKLASNENVYGCSPLVQENWEKISSTLHYYPDGHAEKLRIKLAEHLQVSENELIFGGGSEEVIQMLCRTYLEKGTNTIMANPTFPQYKHYAIVEGAEIREVSLQDGKHDLNKMGELIDDNTRIIWLCTPNNPTGGYIQETELVNFLEKVPKHVLVVVDEAYYEYVTAFDFPETIPLLNHYENVMILRTFSKAYGLAGLRVGYGVASENIITNLNKIRGPFNVTSIAQEAAFWALQDSSFIQKTVQLNKDVRKSLETFCEEENLSFYPSETNFLLIHLPKSGLEISEVLLSKGFIVRAGELLGIPNSIRVTVGKKEDMERFQDVLREIIHIEECAK